MQGNMATHFTTATCPTCNTSMIVNQYHAKHGAVVDTYFAIYCRYCGYGLKEAFAESHAVVDAWHACPTKHFKFFKKRRDASNKYHR